MPSTRQRWRTVLLRVLVLMVFVGLALGAWPIGGACSHMHARVFWPAGGIQKGGELNHDRPYFSSVESWSPRVLRWPLGVIITRRRRRSVQSSWSILEGLERRGHDSRKLFLVPFFSLFLLLPLSALSLSISPCVMSASSQQCRVSPVPFPAHGKLLASSNFCMCSYCIRCILSSMSTRQQGPISTHQAEDFVTEERCYPPNALIWVDG